MKKKMKEISFLPNVKEGDVFTATDIEKTQHFTKAPNRYNEGTIVKLMQENGIGRPSTYATTISTLLHRGYVESQKGALVPTEQGELTADRLEEYFPKYMDASYTAGMETSLDSIADGKTNRVSLLTDFWDEFTKYFDAAESIWQNSSLRLSKVESVRNAENLWFTAKADTENSSVVPIIRTAITLKKRNRRLSPPMSVRSAALL